MKAENRKIYFSILISLLTLFSSVCLLVKNILPSFSGFGSILVMAISGVAFILFFLNKFKFQGNILWINFFVLAMIYVSYVIYDSHYSIYSIMINYLIWGIIAAIIVLQEFNYKVFYDISLVLASCIVISDLILSSPDKTEIMTWTYAVFPCIAVMLTHFIIYRKKTKPWLKLFYIPGIIMLFVFIAEANRGGTVSMIILLYLLAIKSINQKTSKVKNKIFINILLLVFLVLAVIYYEDIIVSLYKFFHERKIDNYAIKKMYNGILSDNITNNRDVLYEFAWKGFMESPIYGNGIGAFHLKHGGWPHNFILQLLYEGGVILASIIVIPTVKIIFYFIKSEKVSTEEYGLFVMFCTIAVPRLFFSAELWNTPGFWLFFTYGLRIINKYKLKAGGN